VNVPEVAPQQIIGAYLPKFERHPDLLKEHMRDRRDHVFG
jgi:hypothetical protein